MAPTVHAEGVVSAACHSVIDNTQPPPEQLRPTCILIGKEEPGDTEDFVLNEVGNARTFVDAVSDCILDTPIGDVLDIRECF